VFAGLLMKATPLPFAQRITTVRSHDRTPVLVTGLAAYAEGIVEER
jgi:hypothetical protein